MVKNNNNNDKKKKQICVSTTTTNSPFKFLKIVVAAMFMKVCEYWLDQK